MNVICLEDAAFYELIDKVYDHLNEKLNVKQEKWISEDEAMRRLNKASKTTIKKYRDEGRLRYTQPDRKAILYDADSIDEYLEKHTREPF